MEEIQGGRGTEEKLLRTIAEGTASVTGDDFFRSLVRHLASALQVRYAFVAEFTDDSKIRVRTIQFWAGEGFARDFQYDVRGTPCEKVLEGTVCYHSQDMQTLFPEDRDLVKLKAESYLGIPLVDSSDEIIGHLAVLDDKPMTRELGERAILLKIFAARAAAELERQHANEALKESEAQFRTLVEHAPEGILVFDTDVNRFVEANTNATRILGYSKEQLLKMAWIDVSAATQSGGRPAFEVGKPLDQKALSGGAPVFEWTFVRASGEEVLTEVRLVRLPKTGRSLLRASITDITDRKQAEEALVSSQKRFSAVLDTVGEGIISIDSSSTIVMMNQEVESIWGYQQKELIGKKLQVLMPEKYRGSHTAGMKRYLKTGVAQVLGKRLELEGQKKDGSVFPLEIRIAETRIGQRLLFTAAVRDVTERRRAREALEKANEQLEEKVGERTLELRQKQAQLVQSEKMASLGQLVAGVAHEINTPLGALKSNVDTLGRLTANVQHMVSNTKGSLEAQEAEKLSERINQITKLNSVSGTATERILTTVDSLRRFARLDEAEVDRVNIHEGIENTLILLHHELKNRVKVRKDYGEIPSIDCFPNQLNQIFMNLLVNASHGIEGRGEITIRTRQQGDSVVIEIIDTGMGIPKENLARIFDPGFTTKGFGVGTGLGLSIVYQIIQAHKGKIEVESEAGKGSTFRITLPVRQPS